MFNLDGGMLNLGRGCVNMCREMLNWGRGLRNLGRGMPNVWHWDAKLGCEMLSFGRECVIYAVKWSTWAMNG